MVPSFLLISQFFIIYIDRDSGKRFATGGYWRQVVFYETYDRIGSHTLSGCLCAPVLVAFKPYDTQSAGNDAHNEIDERYGSEPEEILECRD
jgi:hypothetical protein